MGKDAALLPGKEQNGGVFDPNTGVFGYDRRINTDDITAGISRTMMVAETADRNGPWAAGGFPTVRGIDRRQPYIGPGRPLGGLHGGGCNVLFADGQVQFVSDGIEPEVFEDDARITLREKER